MQKPALPPEAEWAGSDSWVGTKGRASQQHGMSCKEVETVCTQRPFHKAVLTLEGCLAETGILDRVFSPQTLESLTCVPCSQCWVLELHHLCDHSI